MHPDPLAARALAALKARGWTIAVAESVTGGLLAARLTDVPGAGDAFVGGFVTYTDAMKARHLGVPRDVLDGKGAVCAEVAAAMAAGARARAGADVGVSTTGFAGPDAPGDQPVGTVFIGVAHAGEPSVFANVFDGTRREVREAAVAEALRLVLALAEEK